MVEGVPSWLHVILQGWSLESTSLSSLRRLPFQDGRGVALGGRRKESETVILITTGGGLVERLSTPPPCRICLGTGILSA